MRRLQTVGHMYRHFLEMVEDWPAGEEGAEVEAFERLGLKRYCCRRMLLTHVDLIEKLMVYNSESPAACAHLPAPVQCRCCCPVFFACDDVRVRVAPPCHLCIDFARACACAELLPADVVDGGSVGARGACRPVKSPPDSLRICAWMCHS